jgi:hypothetical protein
MGEKHKRRRQSAFILVKMVLRDPRRIKPAAFGVRDLCERQPVALGRVHPVEQPGEKTETYRGLRCPHRATLYCPRPSNTNAPGRSSAETRTPPADNFIAGGLEIERIENI